MSGDQTIANGLLTIAASPGRTFFVTAGCCGPFCDGSRLW